MCGVSVRTQTCCSKCRYFITVYVLYVCIQWNAQVFSQANYGKGQGGEYLHKPLYICTGDCQKEFQLFLHEPFICPFFFFPTAELPPGWEKIDDPVYGVYYVE